MSNQHNLYNAEIRRDNYASLVAPMNRGFGYLSREISSVLSQISHGSSFSWTVNE